MHSLTYQGKPIWFSVMGKPRHYLLSTSSRKELQPNFKSRINRDTWILFADFDRLPAGFQTFDGLREYLETLPVHVFSSCSGKPKAAILVKASSMSVGKAVDTLRSVIGELADYIDRNGVMTSFIRPSQFEAFQKWLDSTTPIIAIEDRSDWRLRDLARPDGLTDNEWSVLRYAASYEKDGPVALPQNFIAEVMGMSLVSVHRAIKSLQSKGMLKLVDPNYTPGREAKTYEVTLLTLRVWVRTRSVLQGIVFTAPPKTIEPGTWYHTIWACTNFFDNAKDFYCWVISIPGVHQHGKYRMKRAASAWKAHAMRNGLGAA